MHAPYSGMSKGEEEEPLLLHFCARTEAHRCLSVRERRSACLSKEHRGCFQSGVQTLDPEGKRGRIRDHHSFMMYILKHTCHSRTLCTKHRELVKECIEMRERALSTVSSALCHNPGWEPAAVLAVRASTSLSKPQARQIACISNAALPARIVCSWCLYSTQACYSFCVLVAF